MCGVSSSSSSTIGWAGVEPRVGECEREGWAGAGWEPWAYKCAGLTQPTKPARPSNEDCERRKFGGVGSFGPGKVMGGAGEIGVEDFDLSVLRFLEEGDAGGMVLAAEDDLEGMERVEDWNITIGG